jgi:alkaline phosphatase D
MIYSILTAVLMTALAISVPMTASAVSLTHGPLLSAVTPVSASIWLRTSAGASVSAEYGTPGALTFTTPPVVTDAGSDFTATVSLSSLTPQTAYGYRVLVDGVPGSVHQFTTAPVETDSVPVDVAVFSDGFGAKPWPGLLAALDMTPDIVLTIGDMDHRNATSLTKSRTMHRELRGPETPMGQDFMDGLIASVAQRPVYRTWDDHDYCKNNSSRRCATRASALQAWGEYHAFGPDHGFPDGIWQRVRYGAVLELFILDTRSNRDPRWSDRTMLGPAQEAWLFDRLAASTATWKVIVTSVPMNGTIYKDGDAWAGYQAQRTRLLDHLAARDVSNVVFVSGDIHSGGAIDDGAHSFRPELSVPLANQGFAGQGTGEGTWNQGRWRQNTPGFGWLEVSSAQLTLSAYGADGALRLSYTVAAEP